MSERSIGVILPVYNNALGAHRTLAALARQLSECPSLELVVVDDGSTDATAQVIARQLAPFPLHRTVRTCTGGAARARNVGAATATSDHLIFLDVNDEPLPGWASAFADQIADGSVLAHIDPEIADAGSSVEFGHVLPGCFAISRRLFDQIGGYDTALRFAENSDLVERAERRCHEHGLRVSHRRSVLLRVNHISDPRRYDSRRVDAMIHLLERDAELLRHDRVRREGLARVGAVCAMRTGQTERARSLAWTALRARPTNARNWGRLLMTAVPALGRRRWSRTVSRTPSSKDP